VSEFPEQHLEAWKEGAWWNTENSRHELGESSALIAEFLRYAVCKLAETTWGEASDMTLDN